MATTNPFYRFEPAYYNAGFFPLCNNVSNMLVQAATDIPTLLQAGVPFAENLNIIRNYLTGFWNSIYNNGNIVVEITERNQYAPNGIEWWIQIYNKELRAATQSQYIQIYFDTLSSLVTNIQVDNYTYQMSVQSSLGNEMVNYERKANQDIVNWYYNGKGALPEGIEYNGTSSSSSLAKVNSVEFGGSNEVWPIRSDDLPAQPAVRHGFAALGTTESDCVAQMLELVKKIQETTDSFELVSFWNALATPSGYAKNYIDLTNYCEYQFFAAGMPTFSLIWKKGEHLCQRFFSPTPNSNGLINTFSQVLTLPFPYNCNSFAYQNTAIDNHLWYDFDNCVFEEFCKQPHEGYAMPIKTGDNLRFNVVRELTNTIGVSSCKVGLFKHTGEFVAEIGEANLPTSVECQCLDFVFYNEFDYTQATGIRNYINSTTQGGIGFRVLNGSGNQLYSVSINLPISTLNSIEDMIAYLNLINGNNFITPSGSQFSFNFYADDGRPAMRVKITTDFLECNTEQYSAQLGSVFSGGWSGTFATIPLISGGPNEIQPTQLQATATIPPAETGCYRFGLYNGTDLYAMSNLLKHDDSDCFSNLIEFSGDDNSMFSGFEYWGNWTQIIRLGINGGGEKPKFDENVYRQSNGIFKRPAVKQNYSIDLHTDYLDLPTQKALSDATRHSIFVWNSKNLFCDGDVEVATIQDFTTQSSFEDLAQVKFSAQVQGYQPKQSKCITC